jgi:hypothetical protein
MTAYDLLESLRSRGAWLEVLPTGGLAVEVQGDHELDDADVEAIRQHKTMLVRWALASIIEKEVGFAVEIAEWTGLVLPERDWPGLRPRVAYQVVPSDLMPADPALEGFWTLVYGTPRLYRTPLVPLGVLSGRGTAISIGSAVGLKLGPVLRRQLNRLGLRDRPS